jgi:chromosome segregation ATPase
MEDVNSEVETPEETSTIDNLADALREVGKLRKENAAKRVKANEVEEAARKWQEHVEKQKTDLERLSSEVSTTKSEADKLKEENTRLRVMRKHSIPDEFEGLFTGSEEDMEKTASLLSKAGGTAAGSTGSTDYFAGRRGSSVGPEKTTQDVWSEWWNSQEMKG